MNLRKKQTTGEKPKRAAGGNKGKKEALRPAEVELLRSMFDTGFDSIPTLAKKFGLTQARVRGIVQYKTDC